MNRYLLLILLSSWAHVVPLSLQCETGVAYPNHKLNVPWSLISNADVAVLKTYEAESLDKCITECCAEKFGSCTVASFKKNDTKANCQHFNCRPVNKCKYSSSNSTDSFSFSSSSSPHILVPSSHASKNDSLSSTVATVTTSRPKVDKLAENEQEHGVTKEAVATYSEEQFALKNDNTTIKPRKGVDEDDDSLESVTRSGVKPRKGVIFDDGTTSNNMKSKVKPRKGVGPYHSHSMPSSTAVVKPLMHPTVSTVKSEYSSTSSSVNNTYKDIMVDDVVSALEKVFEDDTKVKDIKPSTTSSSEASVKVIPTTSPGMHSFIPTDTSSVYTMPSFKETTPSVLQSSLSTSYVVPTSVHTPDLVTAFVQATKTVNQIPMPSSSSPSILEHSKLLFHDIMLDDGTKSGEKEESDDDSTESENERKYKSSMHLVLSLVFGLLVLFSVLGVVAKRVYDSWMRRHYRRMDFLIDGMYNAYG